MGWVSHNAELKGALKDLPKNTDANRVLFNDLLSFTGDTMQDDDILKLAHRTAWKYKYSSDPAHSDTYTFNKACMIDFARKVSERAAPCLNFCEAQAFKIEIRQLKAALEKQQPQTITADEIDAALDKILIASGSALKHYTLPRSLEKMRAAMLEAMKNTYVEGSNACHRAMRAK